MFKVGDKVKCIDSTGNLVKGEKYVVDATRSQAGCVVRVEGDNNWYLSHRFEIEEKTTGNAIKPSYYNSGEFDVIEFCLIHNIPFWAGNSIKYVFRAGKKEGNKEIQDLRKAIEYINRRIKFLEKGK